MDGEQDVPSDDCGGIPRFYQALEILADPKHPDHRETKEWFGNYDPAIIDKQQVETELNKIAKRLLNAKKKQSAKSI